MAASHGRHDCFRRWLCKNSTRYNRTRNFEPYDHAESKKTQKFVFRSALRPNQISFSHSQNPKLPSQFLVEMEWCSAEPAPLGAKAQVSGSPALRSPSIRCSASSGSL